MRYRVNHVTQYAYDEQAPVCHNKVHLAPRDNLRQTIRAFRLHVAPEPTTIIERSDYFGNRVHYFAIQDPHRSLSVTAASELELWLPAEPFNLQNSPPWEQVRDALCQPRGAANVAAAQFTCDSSYIPRRPELADYARPSFPLGRPLLDAASDLTRRIFNDFKYVPQATTVSTPVSEVFQQRIGVCQDFAHLQIACLRSLGLAARYVSGYLRTIPPAGTPRMVGTDASHAWLGVWLGDDQWIEFDPTNNVIPLADHLTVAYGRDYGDVCPIQGVFVGGGRHRMTVSVDVEALD